MRMFLGRAVLALGLIWGGAAMATDITAMSEAEKAAFGEAVREYLLANPEVLVEVIQELEAREQAAQVANDEELLRVNATEIFADGYSYVGGNPEGDITIVEFLDYQCSFCKRAFPELQALLEADDNIRLIVKEFPILGEGSILASRFAIATKMVAGDAAYKDVHDALMLARGGISDRTLSGVATDLGLDEDAIRAAMEDPEVEAIIQANRALGQRLQITGTPSFVFHDQMVRGFLPLEAMTQLVEELRGG